MNYNNIKEENSNFAQISGRICCAPVKAHQIEGENFYEFKVEVDRLSKIKDIIPVTVSERILNGMELKVGNFVSLVGEYRSYNKLQDEKSKLVLHLFAKDISCVSETEKMENLCMNEVRLKGYICKEPVYRKTPFDRGICDVLLAVNRSNFHKSDYIPCIMWGRNARFVANQTVGSKIELVGRIQSREYTKVLENGESEIKTAYEVSCQRIAIISNVANIGTEHAKDEGKNII